MAKSRSTYQSRPQSSRKRKALDTISIRSDPSGYTRTQSKGKNKQCGCNSIPLVTLQVNSNAAASTQININVLEGIDNSKLDTQPDSVLKDDLSKIEIEDNFASDADEALREMSESVSSIENNDDKTTIPFGLLSHVMLESEPVSEDQIDQLVELVQGPLRIKSNDLKNETDSAGCLGDFEASDKRSNSGVSAINKLVMKGPSGLSFRFACPIAKGRGSGYKSCFLVHKASPQGVLCHLIDFHQMKPESFRFNNEDTSPESQWNSLFCACFGMTEIGMIPHPYFRFEEVLIEVGFLRQNVPPCSETENDIGALFSSAAEEGLETTSESCFNTTFDIIEGGHPNIPSSNPGSVQEKYLWALQYQSLPEVQRLEDKIKSFTMTANEQGLLDSSIPASFIKTIHERFTSLVQAFDSLLLRGWQEAEISGISKNPTCKTTDKPNTEQAQQLEYGNCFDSDMELDDYSSEAVIMFFVTLVDEYQTGKILPYSLSEGPVTRCCAWYEDLLSNGYEPVQRGSTKGASSNSSQRSNASRGRSKVTTSSQRRSLANDNNSNRGDVGDDGDQGSRPPSKKQRSNYGRPESNPGNLLVLGSLFRCVCAIMECEDHPQCWRPTTEDDVGENYFRKTLRSLKEHIKDKHYDGNLPHEFLNGNTSYEYGDIFKLCHAKCGQHWSKTPRKNDPIIFVPDTYISQPGRREVIPDRHRLTPTQAFRKVINGEAKFRESEAFAFSIPQYPTIEGFHSIFPEWEPYSILATNDPPGVDLSANFETSSQEPSERISSRASGSHIMTLDDHSSVYNASDLEIGHPSRVAEFHMYDTNNVTTADPRYDTYMGLLGQFLPPTTGESNHILVSTVPREPEAVSNTSFRSNYNRTNAQVVREPLNPFSSPVGISATPQFITRRMQATGTVPAFTSPSSSSSPSHNLSGTSFQSQSVYSGMSTDSSYELVSNPGSNLCVCPANTRYRIIISLGYFLPNSDDPWHVLEFANLGDISVQLDSKLRDIPLRAIFNWDSYELKSFMTRHVVRSTERLRREMEINPSGGRTEKFQLRRRVPN